MTENVNTHLSLNPFRILFFLLITPQILSSQSRSSPICPASTRATQREPRDPHRRKSPSLMARMGRNRFAWLVWTRSALFFFPDHSFSFFFYRSFISVSFLSPSFLTDLLFMCYNWWVLLSYGLICWMCMLIQLIELICVELLYVQVLDPPPPVWLIARSDHMIQMFYCWFETFLFLCLLHLNISFCLDILCVRINVGTVSLDLKPGYDL